VVDHPEVLVELELAHTLQLVLLLDRPEVVVMSEAMLFILIVIT
jgi:hypothetical protein